MLFISNRDLKRALGPAAKFQLKRACVRYNAFGGPENFPNRTSCGSDTEELPMTCSIYVVQRFYIYELKKLWLSLSDSQVLFT